MEEFRKALEDTKLDDLGFVGDAFTWRNNWHVANGYIRERLDRDVENMEWRCLFPFFNIIDGDPRHSGHRPVIADLNEQAIPRGAGGKVPAFRFEASWLLADDCVKVVEEAWNSAFGYGEGSVQERIKRVGRSLWEWDKEVLIELKIRIKKAKKVHERCRRSTISQANVSREHILKFK